MVKAKRLMVAVDESDCSKYALEWALSNLNMYGDDASLVVFHAEPYVVFPSPVGFTAPELIEALTNQQKKITESIFARAKELCALRNVEAETVSDIGDPKEVICNACDKLNIDLLIMGSHGYGAIKRAFLGSVSNYCVHSSKCPVLIVKKPS
eukprot:TRINITY_DN4607_c0_g2_i1.p1 TRINITY_DN4607_c0_g2~~TRINITY_DN4607_c0_g2_i1.p1  ORF type:complete len:152 (+),score=19.39 TRINITY_DN4607_c0_g2_i1:484-939(+)